MTANERPAVEVLGLTRAPESGAIDRIWIGSDASLQGGRRGTPKVPKHPIGAQLGDALVIELRRCRGLGPQPHVSDLVGDNRGELHSGQTPLKPDCRADQPAPVRIPGLVDQRLTEHARISVDPVQ
jgi:hypothetical protein